jgi:hypothetical protein
MKYISWSHGTWAIRSHRCRILDIGKAMPDASLVRPDSESASRSDRAVGTIASNLHTVGLIAIILAFAAAGRVLVGNQSAATLEEFGRVRVYAIALSGTWFLFTYAFLGLRSNVKTMRQLIDPSLWTLRQWGIYALIAIAMFVAWGALGGVLGKVLAARPGDSSNGRDRSSRQSYYRRPSTALHTRRYRGRWQFLFFS